MPEAGFQFAHPWLLLLLLAPLPVWLWLRLTTPQALADRYRDYADARLLPFLTGRHDLPPRQQWRRFLAWSALWALLVTAIAGPRWDYRDVQLFRPGSDLVILLDLHLPGITVYDVRDLHLLPVKLQVHAFFFSRPMVLIGQYF